MPLDGSTMAAANANNPVANNLAIRQLQIANSVDLWLPIASGTLTAPVPANNVVVNVPLRNVGLLKRLLIKLTLPVTAPAGQAQTLGPFGPSSSVSNVLLTDTSNQIRVNTTGWHLSMLATAKRRRVYGAAFVSDTPLGFGNNNLGVISAPAMIAAAGSGTVHVYFEVPVAYTDFDLRGAYYMGVTNATSNLQFTLNPQMFANTGTVDATQAMYVSAGATNATLGNVQWQVYQNVLDQMVRDPRSGQVILPLLDIGTAYLLNNTALSGLVANQDNPFPYPNFRDVMSTTLIFDNGGVLNNGSDIDHFALESANFTNIWRLDPFTAALMTRTIIGDDPPPGTYYFDHRHKPINTNQYGNMQLIVNPLTAASGAAFLYGFESLAIIAQVQQAGAFSGS